MARKKNEINRVFNGNFANSIQMSGLIARKPIVIETPRKNGAITLSAKFDILQNFVGFQEKVYPKIYHCETRSPRVINELLKYDRQIYITCLGKLDYRWEKRVHYYQYYPLIEELVVESICDEKFVEVDNGENEIK